MKVGISAQSLLGAGVRMMQGSEDGLDMRAVSRI
jgi:hypothetical protein